MNGGRLLLVLPLPIYNNYGNFFIDTQACNGLKLWLTNFDSVTLMCPQLPYDRYCSDDLSPIEDVSGVDRLSISTLPNARTPLRFLIALPRAMKDLRQNILTSDFLHFAIGGLWGDWGAIGCLIAHRLNLRFAVWTDRVESNVFEFGNLSKRGVRKAYWNVNIALTRRLEKKVISQSSLGLFNGADCFEAYSTFCSNPHLVFNIATDEDSLLSGDAITARPPSHGPLKIIYAGRAHQEKGIYDWIDAIAGITSPYLATWFGDGPELEFARSKVEAAGLSSKIRFPGAVSHSNIIAEMKRSDVFVYCHKTKESPRNLIESLQCGLPIIGYDTAYPRSLIDNGGGVMSPFNDVSALSSLIEYISNDRDNLRSLSEKAVLDGSRFTAARIFRHRSNLMKTIPAKKNIRVQSLA